MSTMESLIGMVNRIQRACTVLGDHGGAEGALPTLWEALPSVAVVGGQSSGKSSVLESIVGRDFLPRGSGIVTRRPLVLQLHKTDDGKPDYAEFLHLPKRRFSDFGLVRKEIADETDRITGKTKQISPVPIHLSIYSANVVNLTLIDLPGLTKVAVEGQSESIVQDIENMVRLYVEKPNSIILAISPANQDIATSDAIKLAREVDPSGERTFGVLTKLDLMDKGTNALDVLEGRSYKLQHPWVGVVNRSQADINKSVDMIAARQKEREYFETNPDYSHLASKMGSEYLAKLLSKHLESVIRARIPSITSLINKTIEELEKEMNHLGRPIAIDSGAQLYTILELCRAFEKIFKEHLDGGRPGGDRIYGVFDNQLPVALKKLPFDRHLSLQNVRKVVSEADGYQPHLIAPEQGYRRLIEGALNYFRGPAEASVDAKNIEVDIVANGGSEPHTAIIENKNIHIHEMASVRLQGLSKISRPLALLIKTVIQFFILVWFLRFKIPRPDAFVVQNPPSVPTLAAVKLCSWLRRCGFVIDWHNYGYTLLEMSHGRSSTIVKLYKWFEKYFGMTADVSLCVTKAMQLELAQNWGVKSAVLYDRSFEFFRPSLKESHEFFCSLDERIYDAVGFHDFASIGKKSLNDAASDPSNTLFSTQNGDNISLKSSRPALVVSSTSWTSDEDFSLLLAAAVMYDRRVAAYLNEDDSIDNEKLWIDLSNGKKYLYPRLLFIITGKGPDKEKYEEKMKKLKLRRVAFRTMWLSTKDYSLLLGSADLGVSLHTSSSGLDLPMKIVDMFGCGLPVCAVSYSCIEELVKDGENGLLFSPSSPSELANKLMMLFKDFPDRCPVLKALQDGALATGSSSSWSDEWEANGFPHILEAISKKCKQS